MNNKGQVLVLFVIIIPVIILLLMMVIEIGNIYLEKEHTKKVINDIIRENLKNEPNSEKINTLIESNIKDIEEKNIFISQDEIRIYVRQNKKFFGRNLKIEYKIKGLKENENIRISEG